MQISLHRGDATLCCGEIRKKYIYILENNISVSFSELSETKYRKLSDLKQQKLTQSEIKIVFANNLKHKFTQLIL